MAIVGGLAAAGGAGYAANQERGVGGTANDFAIKTNIQSAWIKADPQMQADLNVTVYEGRTLLTGTAPTPEMKAQAQEVASRVPGVRAVYNEIEVAPPEGAWNSAKDAWITSRVRSDLVFDSHVRSVNYTVETVEPLGLSDRLGPQPGRARQRDRHGAIRAGREAGGLLCRDPAGRAAGLAAARAPLPSAGSEPGPETPGRRADDPGRGPEAVNVGSRSPERRRGS